MYCSEKVPQSQFSEVVAEVGQEYEDDGEDELRNIPSLEPEIDAENPAQNKLLTYWNNVQKRVLFTYAFLISPTKGIILEYLDNHGINYCVKEDLKTEGSFEEVVPISFLLTTSILKFCETLFTCAEKSLYNKVFTDELVLAFMKIHWVCFMLLYNRSFNSEPANIGFNNSREEIGCHGTQDFESQRYMKQELRYLSVKDSLMTL